MPIHEQLFFALSSRAQRRPLSLPRRPRRPLKRRRQSAQQWRNATFSFSPLSHLAGKGDNGQKNPRTTKAAQMMLLSTKLTVGFGLDTFGGREGGRRRSERGGGGITAKDSWSAGIGKCYLVRRKERAISLRSGLRSEVVRSECGMRHCKMQFTRVCQAQYFACSLMGCRLIVEWSLETKTLRCPTKQW